MHQLTTTPPRGELLIARSRVVLGLFCSFAIALDPIESGMDLRLIGISLAVYSLYACTLAVAYPRLPVTTRFQVLTHVADIVFFTWLLSMSRGHTSPFFGLFFFSMLCATIRFSRRGTLITALSVIAIFAAVGGAELAREGGLSLNRYLVRIVSLGVIGWIIFYLSSYLSRLHAELSGLAAWPPAAPRETRELISDTLSRSARFLHVSRVLLVWSEHDEPWEQIGGWSSDGFFLFRERPDRYSPLVEQGLGRATFCCSDVTAPTTATVRTEEGRATTVRVSQAIHPEFSERFNVRSVLSTAVNGDSFQGRMFYLDPLPVTSDDLRLADILARLIAARIDQSHLARRAEEAAVAEERVRLARDLHDGLLQSLTAASLQTAAAKWLVNDSPSAAADRLHDLELLIEAEHEELRRFIQKLRPAAGDSENEFRLTARLHSLGFLVERNWDVKVDFRMDPDHQRLDEQTNVQVYRLIHEAVVNAARHASAHHISVETVIDGSELRVAVVDDGHGFPFFGTFSLDTLRELQRGPLTLKERVLSLHGDLLLTSSTDGSRVEITLPLASTVRA